MCTHSYVESAYDKSTKKKRKKKIHTENEHDTINKRIYDRHTESSITSATQYAMCIALCIELESSGYYSTILCEMWNERW